MIPDDELDRYLNHHGELPGTNKLTRRVREEHPEWDTLYLYDYVRRLYEASARRIRAETDAIWAATDELRARRLQGSPETTPRHRASPAPAVSSTRTSRASGKAWSPGRI